MERMHSTISWVMAVSLFSHVFCCVLPTVVGLISLFAGMGLLSVSIPYFNSIHEFVHNYEIMIVVFSGVVLMLGWALQFYSQRIDCHSTGCHHEPCGKKKKRSSAMLKISSLLFLINLSIILFVSH